MGVGGGGLWGGKVFPLSVSQPPVIRPGVYYWPKATLTVCAWGGCQELCQTMCPEGFSFWSGPEVTVLSRPLGLCVDVYLFMPEVWMVILFTHTA